MKGRTAVLEKPYGPFKMETHSVSEPDGDGIVMRVEYAGICGTDIHFYKGDETDLKFPLILGHEVVGVVAALGRNRKIDSLGRRIKEGDRIVPNPVVVCGNCYFCRCLGKTALCSQMGGYGGEIIDDNYFSGGFAEYMHLSLRGSPVYRVDLESQIAVLIEPLAMGMHAAEVGNISIGDTVVVLGTGAIGLASIAAAKLSGATTLIAVGSRNLDRLEAARQVGAGSVYQSTCSTIEQILNDVKQLSVHGLGADVVINATGLPSKTVNDGLKLLRNGGTYVDVGSFCDSGASTINFSSEVLRKGINIFSVPDNGDRFFIKAIAALESDRVNFDTLVSHRYGLERISEIFQKIVNKEPLDDGRQPVKVLLSPDL